MIGVTMHAIDFNMWMSILSLTCHKVVEAKYVKVMPDNVLPEFPRDLTKFQKPSIIVQKIYTDLSDLCFGRGFVGQTWDPSELAYVDVSSKQYDMEFQVDVFGDSNTQCSLMTSFVLEEILFDRHFMLYDYTGDNINNPTVMGSANVYGDIDVTPLSSNENKDYRTAIRFSLNIIRTVVPQQELIDLAKWIKVTHAIVL